MVGVGGNAEELWGMPASPLVPRFPVSAWERCGDPRSIPVSGEAGDAGEVGGLPQVSLMWAPES